MIRIETINIGFPAKEAKLISISTMPIQTTDKICGIYYQLFSETITKAEEAEDIITTEQLAHGNLELTEKEFAEWGNTMTYIEDVVLKKLQLTRQK